MVMKKAVIALGGKQYVVQPDQILDVELVGEATELKLEPLMVIDNAKVSVGQPRLSSPLVKAKVIDTVQADKVTAIRFKAKKRVHKVRGHRQKLSRIQITSIG